MIYLLTVNYNCAELIKRLIASLNDDLSATLIIVNNSTEDKNIQSLAAERVKIIEAGENLGFGKGCNLGLDWIYQQDKEAIVWLVNPDAYLLPDSLEKASK